MTFGGCRTLSEAAIEGYVNLCKAMCNLTSLTLTALSSIFFVKADLADLVVGGACHRHPPPPPSPPKIHCEMPMCDVCARSMSTLASWTRRDR